MLSIIAAIGQNNELGKNNDLIWKFKEDMKFFKEMTTGKVCIMGRNTLNSLPGGRPLDGRINIVLTKDKSFKKNGVVVVNSVDEALDAVKEYNTKDVFVIGGESVYSQFMPYIDTAYITYIDYTYQADKHIENLDKNHEWKMIVESEEQTYFDVEYYYRKYVKA